jgi:aminoglycoside phosphotransferase (APT) family kinase protein
MLDPERMPQLLGEFLARQQPAWRNIKVSSYEVMTGGYSRLLAKAIVTHDDGHEVLVLRGDPPSDKVLIHTDREQEWDLVRALNEHGIRTPRAHFFDATGEHLGTKALVIDFSHSQSFLPYVGAGGSIEGLPTRLAEALASYHAIPLDDLPAQMERPANWDAYLTRRIDAWRRTAEGVSAATGQRAGRRSPPCLSTRRRPSHGTPRLARAPPAGRASATTPRPRSS